MNLESSHLILKINPIKDLCVDTVFNQLQFLELKNNHNFIYEINLNVQELSIVCDICCFLYKKKCNITYLRIIKIVNLANANLHMRLQSQCNSKYKRQLDKFPFISLFQLFNDYQ